jgi:hypothetical protein
MTQIVVVQRTQKLIVAPESKSVGVISAGPIGPPGAQGPAEASTTLTVDGQLLTRASGLLVPITRAALAQDVAFESRFVKRDSIFAPTGALAETIPRYLATGDVTITSGALYLNRIYLTAGQVITNLSFVKGATGITTPTNWWFALYDGSLNLLRQTANQTTTAWAGNTVKTLALSSSYTVPTSGVYYVGFMIAATTPGTIYGSPAVGTGLSGISPTMAGTSTTGLTTTAPNPAAALTASSSIRYCWAT